VWDAQAKQATLLDFRETAPSSLDAALFEQRPLAREKIGVLVGTPGELKGLYVLHQRFGKLPWADVVEPARLAATNGFQVGKHLASMLAWGREHLVKDEGLKALFYPGGKPAAFGRVLTNKKLGATLARVAAEGPKAVYEGVIANELVEAARAHGGGLSLADLKGYQPIQRVPLAVDWEGYRVYTMPLPSAGGMMLAQTLGMFSRAELSKLGFESGAYQHLVAEAMRAAVADRMRYLGDPDFQKVDMKALLDPARLAARRKRIALDRTHAIPRFGLEEHGTHHLTTLDRDGNMVALTTTVNRLFGAKVTTEASGIVLNDELDDFTANKDMAPFDMKQSPNRARPGARPVSSMTPTIVVDAKQRAVLGLGGSGGTAIATNVTQLLLARLAFDHTPKQAVSDKRFYIPTRNAFILLEPGAKPELKKDLERRGEIVGEMRYQGTAVQMIGVSDSGSALPAADPRKHGLGLSY
jgi:gamma-glutamyltranspeptidase